MIVMLCNLMEDEKVASVCVLVSFRMFGYV